MTTKNTRSPDTETARLTLRRFTPADAPFVLRLLNEPSFHEFIGDRGVRTLEDAVRYLEQGPMASYESYGHGLLRVALPDDTPIGMCGIAWNLSSMIIFRIIQGFAVSADYPTAMAIIAM